MRIRKLLGEPMLHFVLIGVALFATYRWLSPVDSTGREIVVTSGVVDDLVTQHVAAKGRAPAPNELENMVEAWVRDEVLYREGLALGLDRDDLVVKRRVRQKLEVMAEEEAATTAPTQAELSAYLLANAAKFRLPAVVSFEQVFLGPMSAGAVAQRVVATTGGRGQRVVDPSRFAQPTLLPGSMAPTDTEVIARSFGPRFAAALEDAPIGEWTGPVESEYGAHYVHVSERTPALMPQLDDVRDQVIREWENERRLRARNDSYARMRRAYDVRIEPSQPAGQP